MCDYVRIQYVYRKKRLTNGCLIDVIELRDILPRMRLNKRLSIERQLNHNQFLAVFYISSVILDSY